MAPPKNKSQSNRQPNSKKQYPKTLNGPNQTRPAPHRDIRNSQTPNLNIPSIPSDLQQLVLNIFRDSLLTSTFTVEDLRNSLQEIKGHLYNRDFAAAFGRSEYLQAYAARWSPTRALGYLEVFSGIWDSLRIGLGEELGTSAGGDGRDNGTGSNGSSRRRGRGRVKVVCLGGGAGAEVVALAAVSHCLSKRRPEIIQDENTAEQVEDTENHSGSPKALSIDVHCIDIAPWHPIIDALVTGTTTAPPLSQYASAAAKANNQPLTTQDTFGASFHQHDLLSLNSSALADLVQGTQLVTLMFTLNELYTTSVARTQRFLLELTAEVAKGCVLLVVDSPGSYSTVTLNGAERRYPMQWLLDHALLRTADELREGDDDGEEGAEGGEGGEGEKSSPAWEKLVEEESRWFRVPGGLRYPVELENMRYQMHLYRRM